MYYIQDINSLFYVDNDKYHEVYAKYYITKIRFDIFKLQYSVFTATYVANNIMCGLHMHASHIDKLIFGRDIGTNLSVKSCFVLTLLQDYYTPNCFYLPT